MSGRPGEVPPAVLERLWTEVDQRRFEASQAHYAGRIKELDDQITKALGLPAPFVYRSHKS